VRHADPKGMSTAAHVVDFLTAPATPAPTRLRLAAECLAEGATPADSPNLIARLTEIVTGPGGNERVDLALHVFDTAAAA
jgi:hypothetical protein